MAGPEKIVIETLSRKIIWVESILIGLTVLAIAYADALVSPQISLGFLYLVPLSYSSLSHKWPVTVSLVTVCVALRQWLGPLELSGWGFFIRDWILTAIFLCVVAALFRLGQDRRSFFEEARHQRDELLAEMKLAAAVQGRILLRNRPPAGPLDIQARSWPAREVGGDYYDFKELSGGRIYMVIADVAGKGLPAALLMPAVQITARALLESEVSLADLVRRLNMVVLESTDDAAYVTLFVSILDPANCTLEYVNGGHVPPLLLRADAGGSEWLEASGPPVGLLESTQHEVKEVRLDPGDLLIACTDGVIEATNAKGEEFGLERFASTIAHAPQASADGVVELISQAVQDFTNSDQAQDDLTLIAIRVPDRRGRPSHVPGDGHFGV